MKKKIVIATSLLILLGIIVGGILRIPSPIERRSRSVSGDIPVPTIGYDDPVYAREGLTVAPNTWFSSAFFRPESEALFVTPYALKFTEEGFGMNQPNITSTPDTVFGSFGPEVQVSFGSNLITEVYDYDDLSASFSLVDGSDEVMRVQLVRGTPVVYLLPQSEGMMRVSASQISQQSEDFWKIDQKYGVFIQDAQVDLEAGSVEISFDQDSIVRLVSIPEGQEWDVQLNEAIIPTIEATRVEGSIQGAEALTRTEYQTQNDASVLIGSLTPWEGQEPVLTYDTLKGEMVVYRSTAGEYTTPIQPIRAGFESSEYTEAQRADIREALQQDILDTDYPGDTYFGGKALSRMAYLAEIAGAFGWEQEQQTALESLKAEIIRWLTIKQSPFENYNFVYNTDLNVLVGKESSFGSEQGNDHHFHYAYFIYAASVIGANDADFVAEYGDMVDLIATSFANSNREDDRFAYLRVFDHFDMHSWASGPALFGDGNNQESSSEAINAWYALYRWALLREDTELEEQAQWLYTQEVSSTKRYWLDPEFLQDTEYRAPLVSIVWGGKLDYATWFSGADEAKFAIQFLPMGLNATYLRDEPARVQRHVDFLQSELPNGYGDYADYLIMYQSIVDPEGSLADFQVLPDDRIDQGNSRTAGLVWIYESVNGE